MMTFDAASVFLAWADRGIRRSARPSAAAAVVVKTAVGSRSLSEVSKEIGTVGADLGVPREAPERELKASAVRGAGYIGLPPLWPSCGNSPCAP